MWVSEPLNMGYFFYYPMILVVVVWYLLYRFDLFEKVSFVIVTAFFIYYLIYIFVPVAGPQFYFPAIGIDNVAQGIFPAIGDYFHHHQELLPAQAMSTASSTTWWRVPSRWASVPRQLSPVRTWGCLRY